MSAGTTAWVEEFVRNEIQVGPVEGWVDRIVASISEGVEQIPADVVLAEAVVRAARSQWVAFLGQLGQPEQAFVLVPAAGEFAALLAQRRHPMTVVLGVYTHARREIWAHLTAIVAALPAGSCDEREVLVYLWSRASAWIDHSIEYSLSIHQAETARISQGDAARRLEAVEEILAERLVDPRQASAALGGYPLSGVQTAFVVHTAEDDAIVGLRDAASHVVRAVEGAAGLIVQPGGRELWCWVSTRHAPDLSVLRAQRQWLAQRQVTVAVGASASGMAGFGQSHRDALAARRLAHHSRSAEALTLFTDVELLTLVNSAEAADRFVRRTLGGLAGPGENEARLRETVAALLELGSVDAAATALCVHKNTVRYRCEKAEALLGHRIAGAGVEVALALRWYARFPVTSPEGVIVH
ncbi:PucR family transcriptional regulator [Nocardioides sp. Bht2]|uniref:PucR family transcriptional regulator n=1 Tax=Nocardioides sp. Bht2 TaxID=3392297 RepID=UPI0039B61FE4